MNALGPVILAVFVASAAGSPTSRRAFGRWTRGVQRVLIPRMRLGCLGWLVVFWVAGIVVLFPGLVALFVASPAMAVTDVIRWTLDRREDRRRV